MHVFFFVESPTTAETTAAAASTSSSHHVIFRLYFIRIRTRKLSGRSAQHPSYTKKIKIHSSCEIEDFVETHIASCV